MKFKDSISPTITRFLQVETYYGVLEGIPNSEINKRNLEYTRAEALRYFGIKSIHLIVPEEKKRIRTNGEEMAQLPRITCMAELVHYQPMKNPSMECSRLCLIWLQEDYAFPIDDQILEKISELDWKTYSEDAYL